MNLRHPAITGPFRLVDTVFFITTIGELQERTIIELFQEVGRPTQYRCVLWVQEMFVCQPFSDAERAAVGGPPDHDFRVDQTASRMAPGFCPDDFEASSDQEAIEKAFDAYCFWLDHSLGRCNPQRDHVLRDCEGARRK